MRVCGQAVGGWVGAQREGGGGGGLPPPPTTTMKGQRSRFFSLLPLRSPSIISYLELHSII